MGQTKHLKKHQFKKGQVANPLGGKAHNPVMKALRNIGRPQFVEIIEIALLQNKEKLQAYMETHELSLIQEGVCECLLDAITHKKWEVFKDIIEQLIGKAPTVINVNNNLKGSVDHVIIPPDVLRAAMKKLDEDF